MKESGGLAVLEMCHLDVFKVKTLYTHTYLIKASETCEDETILEDRASVGLHESGHLGVTWHWHSLLHRDGWVLPPAGGLG